ncbi:MAG TPA: alpha/beta fold hydrolase [Candidatus Acidoferrales bacterium]|nr:alpha/beta fold hydrolase [Candidatus Acidoferrales bacterium]
MVTPAERPIRKDEVVLEDRGVYIESWLPERRSRRRPLVFVHGELGGSWLWERYLGHFAHRGWEGHAINLRAHYWSDTTEVSGIDFDSYVFDVIAAFDHIPPNPVLVGHGMGGLIAMRAAEERHVGSLVLISPALPAQLRTPPRAHVIRDIPDSYGRELLGWQSLPEQLRRTNPDLTIEDVLRVQHLMGRESGAARRTMLLGVAIDRERLAGVPSLVVGGGLDRWFPEPDSERLATWLGAEYEPFGAHSHYGLVVGSESFEQVAETVRLFLESHRL